MRDRHPAKEVEAALRYGEEHGWVVVKGGGHAHSWGAMYCCGRSGIGECRFSVLSTPRSTSKHAMWLRQRVDACRCRENWGTRTE
jgi:hypothetical protein